MNIAIGFLVAVMGLIAGWICMSNGFVYGIWLAAAGVIYLVCTIIQAENKS